MNMFKNKSVLLIEDDDDMIKLIKKFLKSTKMKLFVSRTGEDALDIVRKHQIDIALVDYKLPYKNGLIITNEIKDIKDIPIVLESGEKICEDTELVKKFKFEDVLCKPFTKEDLIGIIEKYLK